MLSERNEHIAVLDSSCLVGSLMQDRLRSSFPNATIHLLAGVSDIKLTQCCPDFFFINMDVFLRMNQEQLGQLINRELSSEKSRIIAYASQTYPMGMYKYLVISGIQGIITADESSASIASVLELIRTQGFYISADLRNSLINVECLRLFRKQSKTGFFSPRELDVFMRLGQGMSVKEIADNMGVSPKTIQTYRERIKKKMEVDDSQAVSFHAVKTCGGVFSSSTPGTVM